MNLFRFFFPPPVKGIHTRRVVKLDKECRSLPPGDFIRDFLIIYSGELFLFHSNRIGSSSLDDCHDYYRIFPAFARHRHQFRSLLSTILFPIFEERKKKVGSFIFFIVKPFFFS